MNKSNKFTIYFSRTFFAAYFRTKNQQWVDIYSDDQDDIYVCSGRAALKPYLNLGFLS